ncbi:MAG TPA: hypothetical protein DCE42_17050 [Myxococcales bacterium]|nr:hypothetical protein [Myxococcales bacterium]
MIGRHQIVEELASLYREEGYPTFKRTEFDGLYPDLRVGEKLRHALVIKVETYRQLDSPRIQEDWWRFDQNYKEWFLCVHNDHWNDAEDLCDMWGIKNATIFAWEEDDDGEIWFHDAPFLEEAPIAVVYKAPSLQTARR